MTQNDRLNALFRGFGTGFVRAYEELGRADRLVRRELPDGAAVLQVEKSASVDVVKGEGDTWSVVVSDETVDSYGDVIEASGWDLTRYALNPVWLVDHWYSVDRIVGRGLNPRVVKKQLIFDFKADPINSSPATDVVLAKLDSGSLRTVSVGFMPIAWAKITNEDGEWTGGYRYKQQSLLENSWVAVPANPNALLIDSVANADRSLPPAPAKACGDEMPDTLELDLEALTNAVAQLWRTANRRS